MLLSLILSYINVFKHRLSTKQSPFKPLLFLLPFPVSVATEVFWLGAPSFKDSAILHSPLLIPFMCSWGLQFAHQVSRMILAHVTRSASMPWAEGAGLWLVTLAGGLDAQMPVLFGR